METMTAKQLIDALSKLDPNAPVAIAIKQRNKVHPSVYCQIPSTVEKHGWEFWVTAKYEGATIEVSLPEGAYITQRKQK